jgi:hypothetical protein
MKKFNRKQKERLAELHKARMDARKRFDSWCQNNKDSFGKVDETSAIYRLLFNRMTKAQESWEYYYTHGYDK